MTDFLPIALGLALLAQVPGVARAAPSEPQEATAGDYVLDDRTASLDIRLSGKIGFPATTLRLTRLEGRLHYDPARPDAASVTVRADPRSIETSRSPVARYAKTLFEPEKYPAITFTSTTLTWDGARGEATGELTFHGVTRPATLDVALVSSRRDAAGVDERVRFSGHGRLKRTEFGLTQSRLFVGDTVGLAFDLEFIKQPSIQARR